jgi:hypothetical protein
MGECWDTAAGQGGCAHERYTINGQRGARGCVHAWRYSRMHAAARPEANIKKGAAASARQIGSAGVGIQGGRWVEWDGWRAVISKLTLNGPGCRQWLVNGVGAYVWWSSASAYWGRRQLGS